MSESAPKALSTIADRKVAANQGALLTVKQLAELLNCSERHVYRLTDRGALPKPVRLGSLVRWNRTQIEQWIASGCPSCRQGGSC